MLRMTNTMFFLKLPQYLPFKKKHRQKIKGLIN